MNRILIQSEERQRQFVRKSVEIVLTADFQSRYIGLTSDLIERKYQI